MGLRLNGSTSGYVELNAPAVAGTTNLSLPATSGTVALDATAGGLVLVKAQQITSSASSIAVNDVFSSTYRNYRIVLENIGSNIDDSAAIQFGNSSTNHYGNLMYIVHSSTTPTYLGWTNHSRMPLVISESSADTACCSYDIYSPYLSSNYTTLSGTGYGRGYFCNGGYIYNVYSSLTGFTLLTGTVGGGNLDSGMIYVYGYRSA